MLLIGVFLQRGVEQGSKPRVISKVGFQSLQSCPLQAQKCVVLEALHVLCSILFLIFLMAGTFSSLYHCF